MAYDGKSNGLPKSTICYEKNTWFFVTIKLDLSRKSNRIQDKRFITNVKRNCLATLFVHLKIELLSIKNNVEEIERSFFEAKNEYQKYSKYPIV